MLFCPKCKREVIIYSISAGAPGADKGAEQMRAYAEKKNALVIFNPPPFGIQRCPACGTELIEKDGSIGPRS